MVIDMKELSACIGHNPSRIYSCHNLKHSDILTVRDWVIITLCSTVALTQNSSCTLHVRKCILTRKVCVPKRKQKRILYYTSFHQQVVIIDQLDLAIA